MSRVCAHVSRRPVRLTPRQVDVLRALRGGACNKEIATALGLTDRTVKVYLHHIFLVLGLTSRLEAALWALAHEELL